MFYVCVVLSFPCQAGQSLGFGLGAGHPSAAAGAPLSAYCSQWQNALDKAAVVMSVPMYLSSVTSPIAGTIVDRAGYGVTIMVAAAALLVAVHVAFG